MFPQDYREDDPLRAFREERLEQKRRRPAILIGIAVGVAVAAAVGWMTFGKYVSLYGDTDGELPLIKADTSLYRIRPKTPGGMDVPNQDKLVYDRLRSTEGELSVERLLPPPEKPEAPHESEKADDTLPTDVKQSSDPIGALAEHVSETSELASGTVYDENGVPVEVMFRTVTEETVSTSSLAEKAPETQKAQEQSSEPEKTQESLKKEKSETKTETKSETKPTSAAPEPKTKETTPQKIEQKKEDSQKYSVQLISARTQAGAEGERKRLSRKYQDLMKDQPYSISKVTVGKNVFYRLRVGSFETREGAKALCDRFKSRKQECIVAK